MRVLFLGLVLVTSKGYPSLRPSISSMSIRKYFSLIPSSSSISAENDAKKPKVENDKPLDALLVAQASTDTNVSEMLACETEQSCSAVWTPFSELVGDWRDELVKETTKPYFARLTSFLQSELKSHKIFPPANELFTAFNLCQLHDLKVIVIGQDPYHGPGQVSAIYILLSPFVFM